MLTTYFSGPLSAKFDVDFVLWDGNTVVERQEFEWLGGSLAKPEWDPDTKLNRGFRSGKL